MNAINLLGAGLLLLIEFTPYFNTNCFYKKIGIFTGVILLVIGA